MDIYKLEYQKIIFQSNYTLQHYIINNTTKDKYIVNDKLNYFTIKYFLDMTLKSILSY
jgi:hypothetical protein